MTGFGSIGMPTLLAMFVLALTLAWRFGPFGPRRN
jgi:hypothetical protein